MGLAPVKAVAMQRHGKLLLGNNAPAVIVTLELPALVRKPVTVSRLH